MMDLLVVPIYRDALAVEAVVDFCCLFHFHGKEK